LFYLGDDHFDFVFETFPKGYNSSFLYGYVKYFYVGGHVKKQTYVGHCNKSVNEKIIISFRKNPLYSFLGLKN
jgi:hypothetical protein